MNPVRPAGAANAQPDGAAGDLFDSVSYADWARGAVRVRESGADVAMLWDSTIAEPRDLLADAVREAFGQGASSRYVSVFADGNHFAIGALARRYGLSEAQIVTATGATGAMALTLKALVAPGDHVLVETPGFDVLIRIAREAGAEVEGFARPAPGFRVDVADLEARLTPRTRAVLLTNLHNPTGTWLPPENIEALGARLARSGVVLVVDEVYADFAAGAGAPPAAKLGRNIVSVSSLTKVLGLFALKFGWLAAHPDLVERIRASAPDGDTGVSKLAHAVAAHVLEAPQAFEARWKSALAATRPEVEQAAAEMHAAGLVEGEVPPFGCMWFPRIVGVDDTRALARRLYERHRVLVAPGEYFGAPGHVRIGFGADAAQIATGLRRLAAGLSEG